MGWQARRLGGSSVGLPDIVCTNNNESVLFSVEAKSTIGKACYIPNDQICRCLDILDMFAIYTQKNVVFAFKFAKSKCNPALKYYFFRFRTHDLKHVRTLKCDNRGYLSIVRMVEDQKLSLDFNRYEEISRLRSMHRDPVSDSL